MLAPVEAVATCFRKYAVFSGRAKRSEYWWFFAFTIVGIYGAIMIDVAVLGLYPLGTPMNWLSVGGAFTFITLLPILAVGHRRLQDTGLPGWIYFVLTAIAYSQIFSPSPTTQGLSLIASLVSIGLCLRNSQPGPNKYGPNPHEVSL